MATAKIPATTKVPPKWSPHTGVLSWASILMYTTIQLKQKKLSSRLFANTTPLQWQRIIIPKMRRHWQALKKTVFDATSTCPQACPRSTSLFSPPEQRRRREILIALCVLVSFPLRCISLVFCIALHSEWWNDCNVYCDEYLMEFHIVLSRHSRAAS